LLISRLHVERVRGAKPVVLVRIRLCLGGWV
jgi:hypothetical protein